MKKIIALCLLVASLIVATTWHELGKTQTNGASPFFANNNNLSSPGQTIVLPPVIGTGGWAANATPFMIPVPNPTLVYTAINTNGTAAVSGSQYCTEVFLPVNKVVTGISVLMGTTVGTNYIIGHIYAAGTMYVPYSNTLANSNVAGGSLVAQPPPGVLSVAYAAGALVASGPATGQITATASVYNNYPFAATVQLPGPAEYYMCAQENGTTDTWRLNVNTSTKTFLTYYHTGTFGVIPATITPPTAPSSTEVPYMALY